MFTQLQLLNPKLDPVTPKPLPAQSTLGTQCNPITNPLYSERGMCLRWLGSGYAPPPQE